MKREPIGIKRLEALHYYVHDLERSRRFYTDLLGFDETAVSAPELSVRGRQRSAIFEAGDIRICISQPDGQGGRASRFLAKHPAGVGAVVFEVEDAERAFRVLDARGGTPISEVQRLSDDAGEIATFSITTPFGGSTFRFIDRSKYSGIFPGFIPAPTRAQAHNPFRFERIDHVTSNFETMAPTLLWLEHVMGFERYWQVEFHTDDVAKAGDTGSGLRSMVMADPHSGVKFANNEPYRPHFKNSQINIFHEEHRGDGIQHAALSVRDIISAVRGLRERGVQFMPTPGAYYDALPQRLIRSGVGTIAEDIATLRELEILVDGKAEGAYLLQIFLKEAARLYGDARAGAFFYEVIQRKGDLGFGEGNFRALFESIEREQKTGHNTDGAARGTG